jgi:hypothetical protein
MVGLMYLGRIYKEAVVTQCTHYPGIRPEGQWEITGYGSVTTVGIPAEIPGYCSQTDSLARL